MKQKYGPFIAALSIIILAASCAKEGPNGAIGPAGPAYTGTISGHVSLYDQYGSAISGYLNKVQVSITATNTINADTNGLYSYTGVVTGNYTLSAVDSGFAATTLNNVQFISGTLTKDIRLSAIPDSFLTGFTTSHTVSVPYDSLTISVVPGRVRNGIVFLSNSPAVTNSNYLAAYVITVPAMAASATLAIPAQDIYNLGFAPGAMVYYAAYSYVINDASLYEDVTTGKKVYNAVNGLPIVDSVVAP